MEPIDSFFNSGTVIRLVIDERRDGMYNMAIDEVFLEHAGSADGAVVVRLYGFSPPTLSVGRFQRTEGVFDFDAIAAAGFTFVRRPSGGRAVLHDGELTYSVAVGKDHLTPFSKRAVYRAVVPLLGAGLTEMGVRETSSRQTARGPLTDPDCFASSGEYEIDSGSGEKLVGSAQMVSRRAILQHGSIPIDASNRNIRRFLLERTESEHPPADVSSLVGRPVSFQTAREAFIRAVPAWAERRSHGGCEVVFSRPSEGELDSTRELVEEKYSRDMWNRKY